MRSPSWSDLGHSDHGLTATCDHSHSAIVGAGGGFQEEMLSSMALFHLLHVVISLMQEVEGVTQHGAVRGGGRGFRGRRLAGMVSTNVASR